MSHQSRCDDLLGKILVVIAVLAVTEGRPDYPSSAVVAAVTVVTLACADYFQRGLPAAIRSDNGVSFASPNALFNLSKMSVWWLRLGISIERIQPGQPQQNGRHDRDLLVTACGRICLHRKRINLSHVFAGQRVGIKEVDDGIWIVSFMHYDLGYIDLEQKTLQPLDNPFGPRLSPMS